VSGPAHSVVLHGHFYQPPREDPWFDEVEREPSAAPYHNWNQRIEQECYRAVVAARVLGADGRIADIMNTLAWVSFDLGPTLCEWLERDARQTYEAILEADRVSQARLGGHGNAVAMPYHHVILPLASRRDKVTEVRWGIADFRRRFGRDPEGMWLPETAVDEETLDVLAAEGMRFTVLAPHQVTNAPSDGSPGLFRTSGGRSIALFVYDGPISHDVAFGGLLKDAGAWARRLTEREPGAPVAPRLKTVATDGETYGHHHRFGEMALAAVLAQLGRRAGVRVENFASFLERHPAREPVTLVAPSSWSCPHGVERWRSDCGCKLAPERPTQQAWRRPLREGLDRLAVGLHELFEREGWELLGDPWAARDAYGAVAAAGYEAIARFTAAWLAERGRASEPRILRARELLELERDALRMFTSCGWFFDDVAGIETAQILKYAAHAIGLARSGDHALEAGLLERLSRAPGNDAAAGSGRDVYQRVTGSRIAAEVRAAAGYVAMRSLAPEAPMRACCFMAREEQDLVVLSHCRTGRVHRFRVRLEECDGPRLTALVARPDGAGEVRVPLELFPECPRDAVRAALRRRLVTRWLAPEQTNVVALGDARLSDVVTGALMQAISALAGSAPPEQAGRVEGLADLLELLGHPVPFDAQTSFGRIRGQAGPARAAALTPIGRRLGFA
jgi:alpha-amylase/alpha-mannosidase (GH57 family)